MRIAPVLLCCILAFSTTIQAQTSDAEIPPALRDWRAWVLHDLDYRVCPFLATQTPRAAGDYRCAWPGTLHLDAGADGATFALQWHVEAPSWIELPGDARGWPQQVTVNAQAQAVLVHNKGPALWLGSGDYTIKGRIPWRARPQSMSVPSSIGLIALTVDGKSIAPLQRDSNTLTLGRSAAPTQADSLRMRVYRKLADGVPARLTTQLQLAVSGQAREVVLGPALPQGFAPLALQGDWPARLDADGKLHVQVQPGNETLTLRARATEPLTAVTVHLPAKPWPPQEIWSYAADAHLRVTAASGAVQVDPRQAEVPGEWQQLPAFALGDGGKLTIEQRSRGQAPDQNNRLTLNREAWLDFVGKGWYARDQITGTMTQGWRFDAAAPYALEQATASNANGKDNHGEYLLLTRGAKSGLTGVEWRTPTVDLSAGLRIAAAASMPVAGWQQTFDSVHATLHFPYGYKLLAAPGADSANGSWMSAWTLLDVFVCAIIALLAWRLLGWAGVAVTLAYLLLGYQETDAPLWSLLIALALALIARALPAGKLARVTNRLRVLAVLVLVLIALPFVASEIRGALYPQLETLGANASAVSFRTVRAPASMPPKPMAVAHPSPAAMRMKAQVRVTAAPVVNEAVVTGAKIQRSDLIEHYNQNAVVQTGPGMPAWILGSTANLSWSGPVLASQGVHLLIAPPWLVRSLRLLLVALLAWLILRLFGGVSGLRASGRAAFGASAVLLFVIGMTPSAQAQSTPAPELLQQLRTRLLEAPKCAPACASFALAQVSADGDQVSVVLQANAGERVALPLPKVDDSTTLQSIKVDGAVTDRLVRDVDGTRWLAVSRGVHRLELDYATTADRATLAFRLKPARVVFAGQGWQAAGLGDDRLLADTLTLTRQRANASGVKSAGVAQQFPPYVEVTRSVTLGLEWGVTTHVQRLAPTTGGFSVSIPVLNSEHVITAGFKVADGAVDVAIADGADGADWSSALDKGTQLSLTAPALSDRAEVWRVLVSPTWHVEFSGVPGVGLAPNDDANDYRNFEFHPLPGETLHIAVTRPPAVQGAQRAIDAASLVSDVGQHASTQTLNFTLRASQGGEQTLTLPASAQVLAVSHDGTDLNLRPVDGKLTLPVMPGTHRYSVRLRTDAALSTLARTPLLALGLPAANVSLHMNLPADRWLLATWGPQTGPAVLYWGELVVMILVAFALAHTRRTRLKFRHWLLLGLGFSTFSWAALLVVVVWLFAFDWRARASQPRNESLFNLAQVGLVLLTLWAVASLISAIPQGLLGSPDMHVVGNDSSAHALHWFADRSTDALPQATAISVPLWVYKALMLAWALWLANALIGWLRDAFAAWTKDGYWRAPPKTVVLDPGAAGASEADAP